MTGQPEWMDDVDFANDLMRELERDGHRWGDDEADEPAPAPDTPDSALGILEPAEHEPECSCYDCIAADPHPADCWCEICRDAWDAERVRLDELNECQRP